MLVARTFGRRRHQTGPGLVGASDERGYNVADRRGQYGRPLCDHLPRPLGIDWTKEYMSSRIGRPIKIANSLDDRTGPTGEPSCSPIMESVFFFAHSSCWRPFGCWAHRISRTSKWKRFANLAFLVAEGPVLVTRRLFLAVSAISRTNKDSQSTSLASHLRFIIARNSERR